YIRKESPLANPTRRETDMGSPSECTGWDCRRVGVQDADDVGMEGAPIIASTANGTPVAAPNVAPCDSAAASVATTSAMAFASGWVRTGLGDVVGESGEHAVNNATVMVPATRRQTLRDMRRMRRSSDGSSTGRCEHDAG